MELPTFGEREQDRPHPSRERVDGTGDASAGHAAATDREDVTEPDATLEEIWAIRRAIAKEFDYDPQKKLAYYEERQRNSKSKFFDRQAHLRQAAAE
jgi:hypothetical protein